LPSVRFLVVNSDYPTFLEDFYAARPGLARSSFAAQQDARAASLFGVADFHARALRRLGHEATSLYVNNRPMQLAWFHEHRGADPTRSWAATATKEVLRRFTPLLRHTPLARLRPTMGRLLGWSDPDDGWVGDVLAAQIRHYRPDVVLNLNATLNPDVFAACRPSFRRLVGQHASPLPRHLSLRVYDLMLSSLPNQVAFFRSAGLRSALLRHAFEPTVLDHLGERVPAEDVSFVGGASDAHGSRRTWLVEVCQRHPVAFWGPPANDPFLERRRRGPAWGVAMYRVLRASRITLNHHIDAAGDHANNLRLFEATGVGTLLLTDAKSDLHEIFDPTEEVVTYSSAAACAEALDYFLSHETERAAVAAAGQRRTLRDHTYARRIGELLELLRPLL
jgi:spore maturation protein CgeB